MSVAMDLYITSQINIYKNIKENADKIVKLCKNKAKKGKTSLNMRGNIPAELLDDLDGDYLESLGFTIDYEKEIIYWNKIDYISQILYNIAKQSKNFNKNILTSPVPGRSKCIYSSKAGINISIAEISIKSSFYHYIEECYSSAKEGDTKIFITKVMNHGNVDDLPKHIQNKLKSQGFTITYEEEDKHYDPTYIISWNKENDKDK